MSRFEFAERILNDIANAKYRTNLKVEEAIFDEKIKRPNGGLKNKGGDTLTAMINDYRSEFLGLKQSWLEARKR